VRSTKKATEVWPVSIQYIKKERTGEPVGMKEFWGNDACSVWTCALDKIIEGRVA
jgi:hypothetical protein